MSFKPGLRGKTLPIIFVAAVILSMTLALAFVSGETAAYAAGEGNEAYIFTVDSGTYTFGTTFNVSGSAQLPVITLKFSGTNTGYASMSFWYLLSDDATIDADENWVEMTAGNYDALTGTASIYTDSFARSYADESGKFSGYMFFRGGLVGGEGSEDYYIDLTPRLLLIEGISVSGNDEYNVTSVTASAGGVSYDLTQSAPAWTAEAVVLTAVTNGTDNVNYFYILADDPDAVPVPFKVYRNSSGSYYGQATIGGEDSDVKSYSGRLTVYSQNRSGTYTHYYDQTLTVRLDTASPTFTVTATVPYGSGTVSYSEGSWTNKNVTFHIAPTNVLSGATYSYYTTNPNELTTLQATGSGDNVEYSLEISEEGVTTVNFVAVSGSRLRYTSPNHIVRIDKAEPEIKVAAVDSLGTGICTLGAVPGSGERAGFASGGVTFTLSNLTAQQTGNTASYSYSSDGGSSFTALNPTNGLYVLPLANSDSSVFSGNTYIFRVQTLSGLSDTFEFTFAILDGSFYTDMELSIPEANPGGWINEPVSVSFTLPAFLSDAVIGAGGQEYEIHGYVTGDTSTDTVMEAAVSDSPLGAGYKVYTVSVARNLNGQSFSFTVYDKAGNAVQYETDENGNIVVDPDTEQNFPLRTGILYLDLEMPSYDVVKTVGAGSIVLDEDDWSAEEVVITITPTVPISGINCYIMRGTNPSTETLKLTADGTYVYTASASGEYGFRLMSGAGNYVDVWASVNIDPSAIEYVEINEPWNAFRINPDGSLGAEIDYTGGGYGIVSTDILLTFAVNQNAAGGTGHFDILYFDYTDFGTLNATIDDYTLYEDADVAARFPDSFLIRMPSDGSDGTLRFAFILRSKAVDANGVYSYTPVRQIEIDYDVRPFEIKAETSYVSSSWTGDEITFGLSLKDADNAANIQVEYYQYRLDAAGYEEWIKIDPVFTDTTRYEQAFYFEGIQQAVSVPGIGDVQGMSYNGTIYFRAVTTAGLASQEVRQVVKIDCSTPDALYSLNLGSGEIVYDDSANIYRVYSDSTVSLFPQSFDFKAPITYYYYYDQSSADTAPVFVGDGNDGWVRLSGDVALANGDTYWLYARNEVNRYSAFVKIYVTLDTNVPQLSVQIAGPTTGSGGGLEFQWTDEAELYLNVTNLTGVATGLYFEYKVDGSDEWVRLSDASVEIQANGFVSQKIVFRGGAEGETPTDFEILGNRINTVLFRILNLGGSSVVSDSVIVRIDSAEPSFDPVFETPMLGEITDLGIWYTEAITVTMYPGAPVNEYGSDVRNPGGVEYFYRVISGAAGSSDYQRMRGNSFSTDDVVGFSGNGEITLELRAVSVANGKAGSVTVTLFVDKVSPTFELVGTAIRNNMDAGTLASGTWTNADSVNIAISSRAANASPVQYTYYWENSAGTVENWPTIDGALGTVNRTQMDVLHVVAVSGGGNGIRVERVFEVKIDNVAPVIYAGNIVNNVDDPANPYVYYIDQVIRYEEANLKSAMYNNFPLSNGQIIATNTVDNSNNGYVHIVIEDLAGNKAELTFYMTIFPLTVNTIELSDEHRALLDEFKNDFYAAEQGLTESRRQYFSTLISRLEDRLFMLEKMVEDYQGYLRQVNSQQSFTLVSDYDLMYTYINYFTTKDELTRYPDWLQEEILKGVYSSYYTKLVSQFNKLNSLMIEVLDIEDSVVALPATNVVERTDYQNVIRVYNAYDSLAGDQKAVFTPNLYNKLTELKRICEVLLMQDETTGISIDGEKLVGETNGAMLKVTPYAPESQYFIEAQTTLYNMLTAADSRKILTINRLYLDGVGAQYDTGTITVTLPIPQDYQNYVYFAVYRLSSDGTITAIDTMRRTPDGTNVTFTTNSLSTFILATTANVVVAETPEKIYGSIGGIEIDGTLLTYITYSVVAMFIVFVIIVILVALRRRRFLRGYNRDHKKSLVRRGIHNIPKGNPPPPSNPARPAERVGHDPTVYYRKK